MGARATTILVVLAACAGGTAGRRLPASGAPVLARPTVSQVASTSVSAAVPPPASAPLPPPPACPGVGDSGERILAELASPEGPRRYHVDFPSTPGPRPLLLAFHGWGGTPQQLEATTHLVERGTARGFVVVRPLGHNRSFNAGTCCGLASELRLDDVEFARAIVEQVAGAACIDRKRVFATGFSNGGFLSHRLGCEASDIFAAVASVSGTFGTTGCAPTRPVPVLHIHGALDGIVPYGGLESKQWSSVATVIDRWLKVDGCKGTPTEEIFAGGKARCVRNKSCAGGAEVVLCRDGGAAHTWPGGPKSVGWGGSQDLDATGAILDFFGRHALAD